ncbi:YcxB family protein [Streptomyces sp. NPDC057411]|uniref:YcxB family protein n=1 Tax=unclassified Streptomyces TaxID=2593676 RepID=UPI00363E2A1A
MHMGGDHTQDAVAHDAAVVAFVYEPTEADYRAAVRRFTFGTPSGLAGLLVPVVLGLLLVVYNAWRRGLSPVTTAVMVAGALIALAVVIRRVLARVARDQYAGVADCGTCTTVVDENGMTTTGNGLTSSIDWRAFPRRFETDELFVLMPRRMRVYFVLPKRGAADPADVDRLRALCATKS